MAKIDVLSASVRRLGAAALAGSAMLSLAACSDGLDRFESIAPQVVSAQPAPQPVANANVFMPIEPTPSRAGKMPLLPPVPPSNTRTAYAGASTLQ